MRIIYTLAVLLGMAGSAIAQQPDPARMAGSNAARVAELEAHVKQLEMELRLAQDIARACKPDALPQAAPTAAVESPLAAASAEARKTKHEWAASGNVGVYRAPVEPPDAAGAGSAPSMTTSVAAKPREQSETERQDAYRQSAKKDEGYWKERMRGLNAQLRADQTAFDAATQIEASVSKRLKLTLDQMGYVSDRLLRTELERQLNAAVVDSKRLQVAITNDKRAILDLQDEAHRAGVPPGWLLP